MSKLNVLYKVIKEMRNIDKVSGEMVLDLKVDEISVIEGKGEFSKDGSNQCEHKMNITIDDEVFTCNREMHKSMMYKHHEMKHQHGEQCKCKFNKKWDHALFALNVLDKMKLEKNGDQQTLEVKLEKNMLPSHCNEIGKHIVRCHNGTCDTEDKTEKCDEFKRFKIALIKSLTFSPKLGSIEVDSVSVLLTIAKDSKIISKEVEIVASCLDEDNTKHVVNGSIKIKM